MKLNIRILEVLRFQSALERCKDTNKQECKKRLENDCACEKAIRTQCQRSRKDKIFHLQSSGLSAHFNRVSTQKVRYYSKGCDRKSSNGSCVVIISIFSNSKRLPSPPLANHFLHSTHTHICSIKELSFRPCNKTPTTGLKRQYFAETLLLSHLKHQLLITFQITLMRLLDPLFSR